MISRTTRRFREAYARLSEHDSSNNALESREYGASPIGDPGRDADDHHAHSLVAALLVTVPLGAEAQPQAQLARIGVMPSGSPATSAASVDAFRQRLRELGYVEGRNIAIEVRYVVAPPERFRGLAAGLVKSRSACGFAKPLLCP